MKLAVFCLLFALTLSAQAITEDSIVSRLNSTLQEIDAQTVHEPISLVIAVQTSYKVQSEIGINFRKIGAMLEPLVSFGRGEIEVLSYGKRVRVLVVQPFTSDSTEASRAVAELKISMGLQTSTSNVSDAIAQATSDLEARPSNRRRIIVVLGESFQDREDEKKLRDVLNHSADRVPNLVVLFPLAP